MSYTFVAEPPFSQYRKGHPPDTPRPLTQPAPPADTPRTTTRTAEKYARLKDVLDTLERWTTIPVNLRDGVYIQTLGNSLEDIKEKILDSPFISNDGVSLWVTRPSVSSKHLDLTAQDLATLYLIDQLVESIQNV